MASAHVISDVISDDFTQAPADVNAVDMARASYHHGDLPEALLTAADALIVEKGGLGFSLREAARRVGVDPAACYRHFRDKEAVLQALARRGFTRLASRMAQALQRATPRSSASALGALAHAYVGFALAEPSAFRAMFGQTGVDARDPRLRGSYAEGEGPYETLQARVSAWAKQTRRTIDIDEASVTLWAGMHGLASLLIDGALRPPGTKERDRLIDVMLQSILAGLGRR